MTEIQQKALASAIKWLTAAGAKFAIIDADGVRHGELPIAEAPSKPKRKTTVPQGAYVKEAKPIIEKLTPGGLAEIAVPEWAHSAASFRSSVCAVAGNLFGKDNYMTTVVKRDTGAAVQVLRA